MSSRDAPPAQPARKKAGLRSFAFNVGDGLFLILIGGVANAVMWRVEQFGWNPLLSFLGGMALAMLAQTLLALLIAPLLGSIESMTPSMLVAMLSPMGFDLLDMMGSEISLGGAVGLGAGFGAVVFTLLRAYGASYRRTLRRAFGPS